MSPDINYIVIIVHRPTCVCSNADPTALLRTWGSALGQIDCIECSLFSIHATLGQTTLRVGRVSVWCTGGS